MDPTASRPEELLVHARWLRALALRMVTDEAAAEDLVQETWLAALRRPPRREGVRRWLASVLKNAARQRDRTAGRRAAREELAAREREDDVPSPEELALRLEQEQRLLAAVGELRDPYKTVVLLRYGEGLSAVEIARRRGVPPATVRTQVHRALEELRRRMDEGPGGRTAWAVLLVPGFELSRNGGGATAVAEVIGMSSTTKIGLAGAAVVLALVGAWTVADIDGGGPGPISTAPAQVAAAPGTVAAASPAESPATGAREVIPAAAAAAPAEERRPHRFEARVVDGRGAPIEGARLRWPEGSLASSPSAGDGRVGLDVDLVLFGDRSSVRVEAPDHLALEVEVGPGEGERTWLGDVALIGGAFITGAVVDEGGSGVRAARVVLTWAASVAGRGAEARRQGPSMSDLWDGAEETTTDGTGRFAFRSFETGTRMLWAHTDSSLWSIEGPFEIAAGDSRELLLTLEAAPRELRITGVVLGPEGRPVPNAHLWFFDDPSRGKRGETADAQGRFDLLLDVDRPHELRAVHPEGRYPEAVLADVEPGTGDVVLRFIRSRELTVAGTGPDGIAVPLDSLYATNAADDNIIALGEDGRLLEPAEPFLLKLRAPGHAAGTFGPYAPGTLAKEVRLELTPIEELTGVVRRDGHPVAGAEVRLYEAIDAGTVVFHRGLEVRRHPFPFQSDTTDEAGRFALTPREKRDFHVRVDAGGLAPAEREVRGYDERRGAELEFDLDGGGSIHGRVVALPGDEPTGLLVSASRGDSNERTLRVGPDGLFRFDLLLPGRWLVEVATDDVSDAGATFQGRGGARGELPWNALVIAGEDTLLELRMADRARSVLHGTLQVDGIPAAGWTAGLSPLNRPSGRPSEFPQAALDALGTFRLETPLQGAHRLTLTGAPSLVLQVPLELVDGDQEWQLLLETGSLELANVPAAFDAHYRPHLLWRGADGLTSRLDFTPDAGGGARLERVPAGRIELRGHPDGPRTPVVVIGEIELRAGESTQVSFP